MENFRCNCDLSDSDMTADDIFNLLPPWPTNVLKVLRRGSQNCLHELKLAVALFTEEDIKSWQKAYQEKTKCTYVIRSTEKTTGRYIKFKQRLYCHHNTKHKKVYELSGQNRKKNTNCPSSINITLRAIKKRYQGKNKDNAPDPKMPCEIVLIPSHNHSIHSPEALRFRKVSDEVRDKLIELFKNGHTATTALKTLKTEIQLQYENYEEVIADRHLCPDYNYCYHLYKNEFEKKYGLLDFDSDGREKLIDRLKQYNLETNTNSVEILFYESNYVICICPPLMRRVHETVAASEMVFLDSSSTIAKDGGRIFIMLTHNGYGGLPLGIIVTSSESTHVINMGFQLLKNMVGEHIFGGRVDGPRIFITDDCAAERTALQMAWNKSTCLLCTFHVLQSVWRWLARSKHDIEQNDQHTFFGDFRRILYAKTVAECEESYEVARSNAINYPSYCKYLNDYWERREVWALCYRSDLSINHTTNHTGAEVRLLKENIFERTTAFNLVQMVDFLLTKYISYYERWLLDVTNNKFEKNILRKTVKAPPERLLEKIQVLTDEVVLVPSETENNQFYLVNKDILLCSCYEGRTGKICKHVQWVCLFKHSKEYFKYVDDDSIRQDFYYIATGEYEETSSWPQSLCKKIQDDAEVPSVASTSTNVTVSVQPVINVAQMIAKGKCLIEKLSQKYLTLLNQSPGEAVLGLQMLDDNIEKLETVTAFVSSCATFGKDYQKKSKINRIPVQPTAIIRRKFKIREKDGQFGGHTRQDSKKLIIQILKQTN